jgi:alginate O-acetyltransferase complex protein AlgI
MLFCSQAYLFFFAAVFTVYWVMPWQRGRVGLLLIASFTFYASWNRWLALLIGVSTVVDYFLALGLERWSNPRVRRALLTTSLVGNLGLLCYFKYANFFLQSLQEGMQALGATASLPVLQVILPVGISFYTFEAINYVVDVYRRRAPAERNLAHFMLFITFFPHLVAGPIVRARDFLPQIRRPKKWDWARQQLGIEYFLMGLFKKFAVADRMAVYVDPIFKDPSAYPTHTIWFAVFAYALQVYCDFSGYTDMAIGSAHMLGYKLAQNFNMPYLASNIADFWRRWHMSLSSWFRDYVFIPLGGSRGGEWKTCRNLLITMTLCGLWHGADWNFILFGAIQALLLIGHRGFRAFVQQLPRLDNWLDSWLGTALCVGVTFFTFNLTLVVFRATSLAKAGVIFQRLFSPAQGGNTPAPAAGLLYTYLVVGLCHWLAYQLWFKRLLQRAPGQALGLGYAAILMAALLLAPKSGQAFIYFQF